VIREDCFWFVADEQVKAMCVPCHRERKENFWFYPGKEKGYGDYDLQCAVCGRDIYKRADSDSNSAE
jgi:hypothetical protein